MDIAALILSTITAGIAATAAVFSFLLAKKTAAGNIEIQIRTMISDAKYRHYDAMAKLSANKTDPTLQQLESAAGEDVLNAYDEACAKYNDKKVEKVRFKKMYLHEIRQLVESDEYKDRYASLQSRYGATKKVYDEWNNLEK